MYQKPLCPGASHWKSLIGQVSSVTKIPSGSFSLWKLCSGWWHSLYLWHCLESMSPSKEKDSKRPHNAQTNPGTFLPTSWKSKWFTYFFFFILSSPPIFFLFICFFLLSWKWNNEWPPNLWLPVHTEREQLPVNIPSPSSDLFSGEDLCWQGLETVLHVFLIPEEGLQSFSLLTWVLENYPRQLVFRELTGLLGEGIKQVHH